MVSGIHKQVTVTGFAPELVEGPVGRQFFLESDHIPIMQENEFLVKVDGIGCAVG